VAAPSWSTRRAEAPGWDRASSTVLNPVFPLLGNRNLLARSCLTDRMSPKGLRT
jgi:hypothetical protein